MYGGIGGAVERLKGSWSEELDWAGGRGAGFKPSDSRKITTTMYIRSTLGMFAAALTLPALLLCGEASLNAADRVNKSKTDSAVASRKQRTYLPSKGEQKLNVPYKTIANKEICLDLYYPEDQPLMNLPTVIYIHGGGWSAGSKQGIAKGAIARACLGMLDEGFCVVSVDYRLCHKGGTVAMRDCVTDAKDAVRYLAKNSESLGLDSKRFFVFGDSAGGQIAQLLLLSTPESLPGAPELADATYRMAAGVSWYGPCDFEKTDLFNYDDREDFRDRFGPRIVATDTDLKDKIARYREMSPIHYLTSRSAPLLMIQGDKDTTIPAKHAYYMQEKAEAEHAPVEIMMIKNAGHNWRQVGSAIEPTTDEIVQRTVSFLSEHLTAAK